jgi:hypothetical protein
MHVDGDARARGYGGNPDPSSFRAGGQTSTAGIPLAAPDPSRNIRCATATG